MVVTPSIPGGLLVSRNITPDKETGIGNWTLESFVGRFKSYDRENGYNPPPTEPTDFNSIMPWTMYAGMDSTDLEAMYVYLQSLDPINNKIITWTPNQ